VERSDLQRLTGWEKRFETLVEMQVDWMDPDCA